jgi:beta-glucosidase-like glycosyl hydrolase/CubicO group peptidase (beta-lactamase class C family)
MIERIHKWGIRIIATAILVIFARSAQVSVPSLSFFDEEYAKIENAWVDSVLTTLNIDQRIGQLIMIRAHSNLGADHVRDVKNQIEKFHVGGMCFFQGTPEKQAELVNQYQELSELPLLIATDAEWGTGMRFKSEGYSFPRALTLGAVKDDRLIYEMGRNIAGQLKAAGVNFNFAPVSDINNNPDNPVIYDRSFGEDGKRVSKKAFMYMLGMQDAGIIACAKHFPGHGDTDTDSHLDLPIIPHSKERLDSVELMPFRILTQQGVGAVMIAHLDIPAYNTKQGLPSTLSRSLVTGLLREEMGYDGLIITDGMEMGAVTKHFDAGEAEAKAVQAGNDIVLLPSNIEKAVSQIKRYFDQGLIDSTQIALSVKRILRTKYRLGLTKKPEPLNIEKADAPEITAQGNSIRHQLIEQSLTLVRNKDGLIPIDETSQVKVALITDNPSESKALADRLGHYVSFTSFKLSNIGSQLEDLKSFDLVIAGILNTNKYEGNNAFGFSSSTLNHLAELNTETDLIVIHFGSPYALTIFDDLDHVLQAYEKDKDFQDLSIQALFGSFDISGTLPITPQNSPLKAGEGLRTQSLFRLGFSVPERVGMSSDTLQKIERLAEELIDEGAAPGFQILIARNGSIVYHKSFGHHTYDEKIPVQNEHLYDLASLTKVLATTTSLMTLYDQSEVNILRPMGYYLEELRNTDKAPLVIEDILIHSARLQPWIPFYRDVMIEQSSLAPDPSWFSMVLRDSFDLQVADKLFMKREYTDSMWYKIVTSELRRRDGYRYSDLGFYMLSRLIERKSGLPLDTYTERYLYGPLGLKSTCFNPRRRFDPEVIVPSEVDEYFRFQELRGYVHDMGSAMMGGVSGHAGLFSNSYEVAVIMQMLLNGGFYGGKRYYRPETVALFTARPRKELRRGLGFDMKQLNRSKSPNMSGLASFRTFGHMGFTGTVAWADPTENLVFVFLSNRTYPTMENRKLITGDYRIKFHDIAYEAIIDQSP